MSKMTKLFAAVPPQEPLTSLDAIVRDWNFRFGPDGPYHHRRDHVLDYCASAPNLTQAIDRACAARAADGKMHNHQSRVPEAVRQKFRRLIMEQWPWQLDEDLTAFDDLYDHCESVAPRGIGVVTVYDTATRIGAYLKLTPDALYMHAGVMLGWNRLHGRRMPLLKRIPRAELPIELQSLPPDEIEDLLCTYRDYFQPWLASKSRKVSVNCSAPGRPAKAGLMVNSTHRNWCAEEMKMTIYAFNFTSKEVLAFENKRSAVNFGNGLILIESVKEMLAEKRITTTMMVDMYNALLSGAPINRFSDRSAGAHRLFALVQDKIKPIVEQPSIEGDEKQMPRKKAETEGNGASSRPGRKSSMAGKTLVFVADANPAREGTKRHAAFDLVRKANKGLKYEDYMAASDGNIGDLKLGLDRKHIIVQD